jgi:hypothetical protein
MRGTWRQGSVTGDPEKALEWATFFLGAPRLGNMEGRYFLRAFEIKRYIKIYVKCHVNGYISP